VLIIEFSLSSAVLFIQSNMRIVTTALGLLASSAFAATYVATFKQGVNSYSGCKSVDISDQYLANPGQWAENGITYGDGANNWCTGRLHGRSGFGYDISPLMRFENLNDIIPTSASVVSANLSMHLHADGTAILNGYYMLVDWDTGVTDAGTSSAPVGWRYRKSFSVTWSSLGATGSGTDVHATKTFSFPGNGGTIVDDGSAGKVYTTALDPVEVQKWVSDPTNNHGFKLQVDRDNVHIGVVQCQRVLGNGATVDDLPMLTIEYSSDLPKPTDKTNAAGTPTKSAFAPAISHLMLVALFVLIFLLQ
jgi:hypothetical protein